MTFYVIRNAFCDIIVSLKTHIGIFYSVSCLNVTLNVKQLFKFLLGPCFLCIWMKCFIFFFLLKDLADCHILAMALEKLGPATFHFPAQFPTGQTHVAPPIMLVPFGIDQTYKSAAKDSTLIRKQTL